ncbi:hypothetical protein ACLOJK_003147 [Asimina triloba]
MAFIIGAIIKGVLRGLCQAIAEKLLGTAEMGAREESVTNRLDAAPSVPQSTCMQRMHEGYIATSSSRLLGSASSVPASIREMDTYGMMEELVNVEWGYLGHS